MLAELPRRADREPVVGHGEGGDDTTAIDAAVERAVVARLRRLRRGLHARLRGARHPRGRLDLGRARPDRRLDQREARAARSSRSRSRSPRAGRWTTSSSATSTTSAAGRSGRRSAASGARLNGAPLDGDPPKDQIELLALEATRTDLVAQHAPPLVGLAHRLRIFGSLALSLCHLADGRVDAVCSLKARAVGRHRGGAAARPRARLRDRAVRGPPFGAAPLDLEGRSRVVAAGTDELCAQIAAALSA